MQLSSEITFLDQMLVNLKAQEAAIVARKAFLSSSQKGGVSQGISAPVITAGTGTGVSIAGTSGTAAAAAEESSSYETDTDDSDSDSSASKGVLGRMNRPDAMDLLRGVGECRVGCAKKSLILAFYFIVLFYLKTILYSAGL